MVNLQQLKDLEENLKEAIENERTRAEAREQELLEKISNLILENTNIKTQINTQAETLLGTIKTWVDVLTNSIGQANKELGAVTFRINSQEKKLEEERASIPSVVEDFGSWDKKVGILDDRVQYLTNEIASIKLQINTPKEINSRNEKQNWSEDENIDSSMRGGFRNELGRGWDKLTPIISRLDRLEDQCRRDNIIFYGVPETSGPKETWEECEQQISEIIEKYKLCGSGDQTVEIVRAHRLGKFDNDATKARPIIVKFQNFKTKAKIMSNAKNLADIETLNISEDYCMNTNEERKKLLSYGKNLKNRSNVPIKSYHANYKTLVIITNSGNKYSFSLYYIEKHPSSWHNCVAA